MFKSGLVTAALAAAVSATTIQADNLASMLAQVQAEASVSAEAGECYNCGTCRCLANWSDEGWAINDDGSFTKPEALQNAIDGPDYEGLFVNNVLQDHDELCCPMKIQLILQLQWERIKNINDEYDGLIEEIIDKVNEGV